MKSLGDQNLTLAESARKAAAQAGLEEAAQGTELQAEVLTTGDLEGSLHVPITKGWLKGGTLTTFVKGKAQRIKETLVGGVRASKKF